MKQILRKTGLIRPLLLMLVLLLGGGNAKTWAETYELVTTFNSATVVTNSTYQAYSNDDWFITCGGNNKSVGSNSTQSAKCKLSSAYGTSVNTEYQAAAVLSKNSIRNISRITFRYNGGSGNSGNIYLGYSEDNNNWTAISLTSGTQGSSATANMTFDFPTIPNAYYAIILSRNVSGTNNFRWDDVVISFYEQSTNSDPAENDLTITNTSTALSFDLYNNTTAQTINYTTSSTGTVTISGGEDYVTTVVDANNQTISVTPKAVTPSPQTITVNQAATENYAEGTATFTVSVTNSTPTSTYTVTLSDDIENPITEEAIGGGINLPSRSGIGGYEFAGWSVTNVSSETTTAPAIIPVGTYYPTVDITLYPVYSKAGENAIPSAFTVGDTGNYAIVAEVNSKYYALPTSPSVNSGKITAEEITVSEQDGVKYVTTANASGFTWTIATAKNGYTISDGTKYIYHSNGGNSGTNLTYGTETSYTWSFTEDGNFVKMAAMASSTTNTRGLLFNGITIGGYSLSNWDSYNKTMILPISVGPSIYYWSSPVAADTRAVTTTTIDDDGISNTNVWAGTAAGQLTATVKVGVDAVPNAIITWTGDNNEVATIDASGNVTLVAAGTVNFTATYAGDEGNKGSSATYNLIVVNQNPNAHNDTWNLSEKSYSSATTDKVVWESSYAAMVVDKAEAGTNANNYLPTAYSSSRFYRNSLLSIRPAFGYKVTSIEFTATSDNYATALRSSTWTNASTNNEESGTTVIVTPNDPTKAISAVISGTCGFTAVKITYETVSMEPITVHLNGSGYATFASTYAIDLTDAQANGYSAWQIKAINDNIITFERLTGKVSWNTGMLMKGEANSDISLTPAVYGNSQSDNKLVGITEATAISAGEYYGLSGNTFVKVNAGTVPAGKALLPANLVNESTGGNVKAFTFVFNDLTTGVNAVDNGQWTMDNGAIFDLSGRRLSKPAKGINIINGKKVVVK